MDTRYLVLVVDDEPVNVMTLVEVLQDEYDVVSACDASGALEMIRGATPPDIVLLDVSMPGVNGFDLCRKLSQRGTTRRIPVLFVTGLQGIKDEVRGLEAGAVDYITKPITPALVKARVAVHIQLKAARRTIDEMLVQTLAGSVKFLTGMLAAARPLAFSHASRVQLLVSRLVRELGLKQRIQFDLAAMLSQMGCMMLPEELLSKFLRGEKLSHRERDLHEEHVRLAGEMLGRIPRMEKVAEIVARQREPFGMEWRHRLPEAREVGTLGAHLLRVAIDFDRLIVGAGVTEEVALDRMREDVGQYDPVLLDVLQRVLNISSLTWMVREFDVDDLTSGMILDEDVRSDNGVLLATQGMKIEDSVKRILSRYKASGNLSAKIQVQMPMGCDVDSLEGASDIAW